jgi:hypothetical protein
MAVHNSQRAVSRRRSNALALVSKEKMSEKMAPVIPAVRRTRRRRQFVLAPWLGWDPETGEAIVVCWKFRQFKE